MSRRRSIPWIHRTSRLIIAALAGLGALNTGYLSFVKLSGGAVACVNKTAGCDSVLSSPWATVFGVPLAIFGFLAYASMTGFALAPLAVKPDNKEQRKKLENLTWLLLLAGSIAMTVFSGYLMYLLAFQIKAVCYYCIASALFSLSILVLTIIGRSWEDIGQILFTAVIVGMVTLIATLAAYAPINSSIANAKNSGDPNNPNRLGVTVAQTASGGAGQIFFDARKAGDPDPKSGWEITTTSGDAEIQLANHLAKIGAKEYVAYWCPHCHEQKLLFGKEAYKIITDNNVKTECAQDSPVGKPQDCQAAGVQGFPTWIINGKSYSGVQNLDQLAKASGYTGPRNFKYFK